jgi:hypothetical protein
MATSRKDESTGGKCKCVFSPCEPVFPSVGAFDCLWGDPEVCCFRGTVLKAYMEDFSNVVLEGVGTAPLSKDSGIPLLFTVSDSLTFSGFVPKSESASRDEEDKVVC